MFDTSNGFFCQVRYQVVIWFIGPEAVFKERIAKSWYAPISKQ